MGTPNKVDLKDATIKLIDGTGTPNELTLKVGEGNLTFTEQYNMEYLLDRGNLDGVREGDQVPMEVSFQVNLEALKSSTGDDDTPWEFLRNRGQTTLATVGEACDPFAVDIEVTFAHGCTGTEDEEMLFEEFRVENIGGDLKAGQLSFSGKCNKVAPTPTRS